MVIQNRRNIEKKRYFLFNIKKTTLQILSIQNLLLPLHRLSEKVYMVNVAQLVRATDCGSVGRGFEPHLLPHKSNNTKRRSIRKNIPFLSYVNKKCDYIFAIDVAIL